MVNPRTLSIHSEDECVVFVRSACCRKKWVAIRQDGTDHRNGVIFDQQDGSAVGGFQILTQSARTPASLGTLRKARSESEPGIGRGKAWNGRAGQAFALVESGVADRATTNSSPRTATGHKQDDQTAKT
jgi:hypothetical protein